MISNETRQAIESILMVADHPVEPTVLAQLLEVPKADIETACATLAQEYEAQGRGFILVQVAGGFRFQSHPELAPYVERFVLDGQSSRLSAAALETLAIVAYKQPISRMQIAAIRGVSVDGVLRTLQQRGYVDEVSRDPGPGNAVLFGTTSTFLERVGLNELADLPPLAEFVPGADVVEAMEEGLRPDPLPKVPPVDAVVESGDAADDGSSETPPAEAVDVSSDASPVEPGKGSLAADMPDDAVDGDADDVTPPEAVQASDLRVDDQSDSDVGVQPVDTSSPDTAEDAAPTASVDEIIEEVVAAVADLDPQIVQANVVGDPLQASAAGHETTDPIDLRTSQTLPATSLPTAIIRHEPDEPNEPDDPAEPDEPVESDQLDEAPVMFRPAPATGGIIIETASSMDVAHVKVGKSPQASVSGDVSAPTDD
mgnify:CR=1 FL=1